MRGEEGCPVREIVFGFLDHDPELVVVSADFVNANSKEWFEVNRDHES